MALPPLVPNTAFVVLAMEYFGQRVINTFWIHSTSALGATELGAIGDVFVDWVTGHYKGAITFELKFLYVDVKDMTVRDGMVVRRDMPTNTLGTDTSFGLPGGTSLAVKHGSNFSGRSRRGRTFVVGIPENKVDGNSVTDAYAAGIKTAYESLDGLVNTAGFQWSIVSLYQGYTQSPPKYKKVPTPRSAALITDITTQSVNHDIDSQRRRLKGRGQ